MIKKISLPTLILGISAHAALDLNKQHEQKKFDEEIYNWTVPLSEAFSLTIQKHYHADRPDECMVHAIDGFLSTLDKHSCFLDPKTYKLILDSTSGEFYGIGVVIDNSRQSKDKHLTVVDIIPEGPADKVGIKALDKIIEIEGKPLEGMATEEATARLKGPRNSVVTVKVLRDKQQQMLSFDITRDLIKEQNTLCFNFEEQKVHYLMLNTFSDNSVKQLERLVKNATKQEAKAIILDLRNNLGGSLAAAVEIVGLFLQKGSLVVMTKDKNNEVTERYTTKRDPIAATIPPIFILINNYTASAAEILAGCLTIYSQDIHHNSKKNNFLVFLVGSQSHGKGSVQEVIPVSNNCAIKLTTQLYYFANNTTVQAQGLTPDFVIERTYPPTEQVEWFTKQYGFEKGSSNYIRPYGQVEEKSEDKPVKKESEQLTKSWPERIKEALQKDNQLRATINLINLLDLRKSSIKKSYESRQEVLDFLKLYFVDDGKLLLSEVK